MTGMPCGDCCVCDEELDHADSGFCKACGRGFHWGECGTWKHGEHRCDNCEDADIYG